MGVETIFESFKSFMWWGYVKSKQHPNLTTIFPVEIWSNYKPSDTEVLTCKAAHIAIPCKILVTCACDLKDMQQKAGEILGEMESQF